MHQEGFPAADKSYKSEKESVKSAATDATHVDSDSRSSCCHKLNPKSRNLVVCIDGTSNQFGQKNTNVIELYNLILKDVRDNQRTWYNSGIGTYARPSWKSLKFYRQVLYHKIDLAIAWDFEKTVLGAYRWLSDNYEPDDCIFLFGFSRGAYQVRVLSAMIEKVGLIHKGNEMQIPFAFELYADPKSHIQKATRVGSSSATNNGKEEISMAERFKGAFSYKNVKVHFVGAWDTVSSIGVVRGKTMLPLTIDGMKHVCYFRHALALDERRVKFLPEYAFGGAAAPLPAEVDGVKNATEPKSVKVRKEKYQHTKEVWFAGTHSDIGGGNTRNEAMDRSRPPLRWMVLEAQLLGLRTERFKRPLTSEELINIQESLTWPWKPFELIPFFRLTFTRKEDARGRTTYKPHFGAPRKIHPGQKIHDSLLLAGKSDYTPKARPPDDDSSFWQGLRTGEHPPSKEEWIEVDLYKYIETLVNDSDPERHIPLLLQIATARDGLQAVYDKVVATLGLQLGAKEKYQVLRVAKAVLKDEPLDLLSLAKIRPLISNVMEESERLHYQKEAINFGLRYSDSSILIVETKSSNFDSIAISADGSGILSVSGNGEVQLWHSKTGEKLGEPQTTHDEIVRHVVFLPDGKRAASCSDDKQIHLWELDNPASRRVFMGHTGGVNSIAFSSDCKKMVSGADDRTVRIWDLESTDSTPMMFKGHEHRVRSVCFSVDGRRVFSGSDDGTIRIWDVATGKELIVLVDHSSAVYGISVSPDGELIASASGDNTVRLWDAHKGVQTKVLEGHEDDVNTVAFSPDGKWIASGSDDHTVRIWNRQSGAPLVGGVLKGHTGMISSVVFSPDGQILASGSMDTTIRVWDLEFLRLWQKMQEHSSSK